MWTEDKSLKEAEAKWLIRRAYKRGLQDGWDGKPLDPTILKVDEIVNDIYIVAMMAKQERIQEDVYEESDSILCG